MARTKASQAVDINAVSTDVTERFDAVRWNTFISSDMAARAETRTAVQDISKDLMKIAEVDPARAARIWDEHVPRFVPRPLDLPLPMSEPEALILNTIEPSRRRRRKSGPQAYLDAGQPRGGEGIELTAREQREDKERAAKPAVKSKPVVERPDRNEDVAASRARMLLEGLNQQYRLVEDKYHFRDRKGEVAFEARDKKLLTEHETPSVVTSMLDLAEARAWFSIKLSGTKEFRREAWLQASLRQFEVSGYKPDKLDKARLEDLKSERGPAIAANTIVPQAQPSGPSAAKEGSFKTFQDDGKAEARVPLTPVQGRFMQAMELIMRQRGDSAETIAKARELATERLTTDRIHVGKLVEVGTAPYLDKWGETPSHFVTLADDAGAKSKVWGVDLPRAVEASGAKLGEKIAIAFRGRQPVSVDMPIKDDHGQTVRTERQTVERNRWEVVRFDRLREDAKVSVAKALHRQDNPATLKVFDRSARPSSQATGVDIVSPRSRERAR